MKLIEQIIDEELADHLEEMKFQPMICGIRWLRLFFVREFPITQVLHLWDYIFFRYANDLHFQSIEEIALAMVSHLRSSLLGCASLLEIIQKVQRYPKIKSIMPLVANAHKIKSEC